MPTQQRRSPSPARGRGRPGGAEEARGRGIGVEKRSHPAATTSHRHPGAEGYRSGDAAAAAAESIGSPLICHLSKGGRFSAAGRRTGAVGLALPDAADPGCRAMVPYTASPGRSPRPEQQQHPQHLSPSRRLLSPSSFPATPPPPLLALPAPAPSSAAARAGDSSLRSVSSSSAAARSPAGGLSRRRLEIPLEIFPVVFQYMDAPTLCSVSSVCKEWRRQGNDDRYWSRLCRARFNLAPDAFAPPPDPVKRFYQLHHGSFKDMCRARAGGQHGLNGTLPSISARTSAQLLMGLMMSNAM